MKFGWCFLLLCFPSAACTVSVATDRQQLSETVPGYRPTISDWVGTSLSFSDINAQAFQSGICSSPADDAASPYLISLGGSSPSLTAASTAGGSSGNISVTLCSLKIITAAVNLCIHRTASRNVLDKLENYGVDQVVAVAGTAAAVAALSHANATDTALATAGAAGLVALSNGVQKAVPATTGVPISTIVGASLQYLVLVNGSSGGASANIAKGLLFDAAFSACPISS